MKLTDLRGILQYIPEFREKTFVLAIDGEIVSDERFATRVADSAAYVADHLAQFLLGRAA